MLSSFPGVIRGLRPLIVCGDPEFLTRCSLLYKMAKKVIEPFRNERHGDIPSYTEGRFLPQLVFVFYAFIVFGLRRRLPF